MVNFVDMGRQAARKAVQIIKGRKAGMISIEDALDYVLAFNIARVRQLNLTLSPELLAAAAELYESIGAEISSQKFHLLMVQSQAPGIGPGADVENGLLAKLADNEFFEGSELRVSRLYMQDATLKGSDAELRQQGRVVLQEIYSQNPDLVVILGDAAAREVMLPLVDSGYPFLFGATILPPGWYNKQRNFMESRSSPGHNVSGVSGELHYEKTLEFARIVFPEARKVVVITPGIFPWKDNVSMLFKRALGRCPSFCDFDSVEYRQVTTFNELKERILHYNDDATVDIVSVIYPVGLLRGDGMVSSPVEIRHWLNEHQLKPDFAFSDRWVKSGYLMAAAINYTETGLQLGAQALAVLKGCNPGEMAIEKPASSHLAINLARAEYLDVDIPVDILEAADKIYQVMEPDITQ